jgi:hypothetical protein
MNYRRTFERMARQNDALVLEVLSEGASPPMRAFLRVAARWWVLERWWLFVVAWSRPMVAVSRRKRHVVAEHAEHRLAPPFVSAALDRAFGQCVRFDLERRVRESARPERWYSENQWREIQQRRERGAVA